MSTVQTRADLPPTVAEEVADRVYAYAQADGSWWINTAGFVVGGTRVTGVDSCATERRTRGLLEAIQQVAGLPVRTLVNTHYHGDHTYGNGLFTDATVVAHERCRRAMLDDDVLTGSPPIWDSLPDWGNVRIAPPTLTFTDDLTLWVDEIALELRHIGPRAHTDNDVVVWVPDRRVLFTGDLVFHGGTPLAVMGSVTGSLAALDQLRSYGAEVLVPGHGRPCPPSAIDLHERYFRFVLATAADGRAAGLSPLEAAREADLGEFGGLLDKERIVLNLHRAYADLNGTARLDVRAAFYDALAYNGGRRLRCVA